MFGVSEAYRQRPIRFVELRHWEGWRLKLYSIAYVDGPIDWAAYEAGLALALPALPQPADTAHRPGVGFVIAHQGRGVHYLVLNWWDNENEYFNRVYVRPLETAAAWRAASGGESACVWDLQVVAFERDAFVTCVLARPSRPDIERYLTTTLNLG